MARHAVKSTDGRDPGVSVPPVRIDSERRNKFGPLVRNSLGSIVRAFKAAATKEAHESGIRNPGTIWQRSFYDRLIRDTRELEDTRRYIRENPSNWATDRDRLR